MNFTNVNSFYIHFQITGEILYIKNGDFIRKITLEENTNLF